MTRASFRSFGLASFLLFIGAALPACGGTGDLGDIFGTSGGQGTPTGSGGGGQGGAGQGGAGQGGAGQGGVGQGGATQSSSSASASSSSMAASSSSSSMASSSSGGPVAVIACGNESCPVGGENACCFDRYEINPPPQAECVSGPVDNDNCQTGQTNRETRIECQLPEHCPAATPVCCGTFNQAQNSWYSLVRCVAQCGEITLCDPQNPQCPAGTTCQASATLPSGYFVCRT